MNIQFHRKLRHRNRLSITFQSLHKLLKFSKFSPLACARSQAQQLILALPDGQNHRNNRYGQNTESTLDTTRRRGVFSSYVFDNEIWYFRLILFT